MRKGKRVTKTHFYGKRNKAKKPNQTYLHICRKSIPENCTPEFTLTTFGEQASNQRAFSFFVLYTSILFEFILKSMYYFHNKIKETVKKRERERQRKRICGAIGSHRMAGKADSGHQNWILTQINSDTCYL